MADRYLIETSATDGYLLEDASGVLLLEGTSAIIIATGMATETDSALALSRLKLRAAGLSSETDTVLALGRIKKRAISLSVESDSAPGLSRLKLRSIGISSETDVGFALGRIKKHATGLSAESDSAFAEPRLKRRLFGLSMESDLAVALLLPPLAPLPEIPQPELLAAGVILQRLRRERKVKRVGLGFTDADPNRARLHKEFVTIANEMAGVEVKVTTGAADTEFAVRHPELDHVPNEAAVILTTVPGSLYASRPDKWSPTVSFWKFTGANAKLTIRLR